MTKQTSIPCLGYNIAADWHEGASTKKIILTFIGFGSSKKSNFDFMAKLVNMTGMSALVVDFSGHGESPFNVDETVPAQHLLEATKAYDWLKANYPESVIHVMGTSYGGFMAAYLTRFRSVEKLILRTPAIYEPSSFYTEHRLIDKILVREYRKTLRRLKSILSFCSRPSKPYQHYSSFMAETRVFPSKQPTYTRLPLAHKFIPPKDLPTHSVIR